MKFFPFFLSFLNGKNSSHKKYKIQWEQSFSKSFRGNWKIRKDGPNLFNDLLISSENVISDFENTLSTQLDNRQVLLKQILILNIVMIIVVGLMIILALYIDMQANKQVFSALVAINPSEVTEMEAKLDYFSKALLEMQEEIISRKLYSIYQKNKEQSNRGKFRVADLDSFSSQRGLYSKIKDSLIIGAFLC